MYNPKPIATLLALLLLTSAWGCSKEDVTEESATETTEAVETTESETTPETAELESETVPETSRETETETEIARETEIEVELEPAPLLPDDAELVENPVTSADIPSRSPEEMAEAETEDERICNYLNGKAATEDERARRPVAIMMNNIKNCLPQDGIAAGDIYYECSAEGGITRIMMLVSDYESLGQVGSIRSSRDYFVDFLANHDAIYVHAGGSEMAYDEIFAKEINNLDGVNMYIPNMFYRDNDRLYSMGMEHSLMTTGENIADGIEFKGYTTTHEEDFVPAFRFYDENTDHQLAGSPASHIHMKSTSVQTVDFVYDEETREYLRFQYNGMPHVDGLTEEQISVKNVIILFTDIRLIPGDTAGRLRVATIGSGEGYYITNGRRKVVRWTRESDTAPVKLTYREDDREVVLNCGKTFICVVDNTVASTLQFNYTWDK